jgi:AcrR family transcriptional regulator
VTRADRRPRRRLDAETRRTAILGAARDAFATARYQDVALAAIATAAGASEALVLRYFGSKAALYVACVQTAVDVLLDLQAAADAALPPDTGPYPRITTSIRVYLDFIAAFPRGWAGPLRTPSGAPAEAEELRVALRAHYVGQLGELLGPVPALVLHGYLGYVDAACLAWVEAGLPDEQREIIVATAVGALKGALRADDR